MMFSRREGTIFTSKFAIIILLLLKAGEIYSVTRFKTSMIAIVYDIKIDAFDNFV